MKPLPRRMRPREFKDVLGQDHIAREDSFLLKAAEQNNPQSAIFWGPPGSGKTTLLLLLAEKYSLPLHLISATVDGIKKLREVIDKKERCTVFIDEIHRWNKAQQDTLLSYLEEGDIVLLGATTENPAHYINKALLSRVKLVRIHALEEEDIKTIVKNALEKEIPQTEISPEALDLIVLHSSGDARRALRLLEESAVESKSITMETVEKVAGSRLALKDKDEHYHLISAFIKSMRASDPDAAIYWLCRMEDGGEDPRFIARRMIIFASEDVGLARSGAASIVGEISSGVEIVGEPECWILHAHAASYLALCPKDRTSYSALQWGREMVKRKRHYPVPRNIRQENWLTSGKREEETHFLPKELGDERFWGK